jgi:hypothetical protein
VNQGTNVKAKAAWKFLVGIVVVVIVLAVIGLIAVHRMAVQRARCDDWKSLVRHTSGMLAPPPDYIDAVERQRPAGCEDVLHPD